MSADFQKHRLSFTSFQGKQIFGENFKSGKQVAVNNAAKLLLSDHLNDDGTINEKNTVYLLESELWSYIFYLYYNNRDTIQEFQMMSNEKGNASAENFYDVVTSVIENTGLKVHYNIKVLTKNELIKFIKIIINKYRDKINNPVMDHFNAMIKSDIDQYFKNLQVVVRTGRDNVRISRDPYEVEKSDVIIKIGYN
uniref:Uncharacterized protein n=1 Tax=viral metagenome TaxID=1070528 RepID=A0A6C0BEM5_9ZZZZ